MGIDEDDLFEVMYFFQDPEFGTLESDYLGVMPGSAVLKNFPEVSKGKLEEIKRVGSGTVLLNIISGDYVSINYLGKEELTERTIRGQTNNFKNPHMEYQGCYGCGCLLIFLFSGILLSFVFLFIIK